MVFLFINDFQDRFSVKLRLRELFLGNYVSWIQHDLKWIGNAFSGKRVHLSDVRRHFTFGDNGYPNLDR